MEAGWVSLVVVALLRILFLTPFSSSLPNIHQLWQNRPTPIATAMSRSSTVTPAAPTNQRATTLSNQWQPTTDSAAYLLFPTPGTTRPAAAAVGATHPTQWATPLQRVDDSMASTLQQVLSGASAAAAGRPTAIGHVTPLVISSADNSVSDAGADDGAAVDTAEQAAQQFLRAEAAFAQEFEARLAQHTDRLQSYLRP